MRMSYEECLILTLQKEGKKSVVQRQTKFVLGNLTVVIRESGK